MRPAFVGGLHRSGTSLFARCLVAHPHVGGFAGTGVWEDEGQHLQDALLPARVLGGPGRFAHHPAAHLLPVGPAAAERLRGRLLRCWEPLWPRHTPWVVSKSPPDLLRGRLLQQLFPDAPLFVVRRHPLAVALATRRMGWAYRRRSLTELVAHWVHAHDLFEEDRPHLRNVLVVDHDRLIQAPAPILAAAFGLLELEPVPPPEPLRDTDARYRLAWARAMHGPGGRRRRAELAPWAERVAAHGYDLLGFADGGRGPGA